MTDAQAVPVEGTEEISEDDALGAMFDKLSSEDGAEETSAEAAEVTEAVEDEAPEEEEPESTDDDDPEDAPEDVEAPPDLPSSLKAKWAGMDEGAREAVLSSHRDLSRKLADQGRVVQATRPIYDVLLQAVQEIPTMADMTPAQIAQDVFTMAKIQGDLAQDPVRAILGIAQQYGALDGIRQAMGGQNPDQAAQQNMELVQEVRSLRAQLQQAVDPTQIDQRITQTMTARDTERMVSDYAGQKEYWSEVESSIPQLIPLARQRLGERASAQDVLDAAYDMAIHTNPDLRAKVAVPAKATTSPDPARTAAQRAAKSVNVKSRPGSQKPLTEDQALAAIWDKHKG